MDGRIVKSGTLIVDPDGVLHIHGFVVEGGYDGVTALRSLALDRLQSVIERERAQLSSQR